MSKKSKIFILLSCIFVLFELHLSNLIQTTSPPDKIQYLSIVLACIFCILFAEKTKSYALTQTGLLFTVFADLFLVVIDSPDKLVAMLCFSVTQIAYFLRLYFEDENKLRKKVHLILRISLSFVMIIATSMVLGKQTDTLAIVSMFYYTNLILNVVFAFIRIKKSWIFALGLLCFVICDTFIGIANVGPYMNLEGIPILHRLLHPGFNAAWAFYVPSQALLAISLLPNKIKKRV